MERDFGFRINQVQARHIGEKISVRVNQSISLSAEAREALQHGVPIRIQVDLALRQEDKRVDVQAARMILQLDYLPLSDHYQVTLEPVANGQSSQLPPVRSFPRLRHAIAVLSDLEHEFEKVKRDGTAYEVRVRSRIDRSNMPGPLQLPALLSSQWQHDSGWTSEAVSQPRGVSG